MRKLISAVAAFSSLLSQAAYAKPLPTKLTGVIIFSCVTMQRGVKIDAETFKIDFSKKLVNNRPVEMRVDDLSIKWGPKKSADPNEGEPPSFDEWIWHSVDRFSGKLVRETNGSDLTICHVAGHRKF